MRRRAEYQVAQADQRDEFFKSLDTGSGEKRQDALIDAVKSEDVDLVAALQRAKTVPDTFGKYGSKSALMIAAEKGNCRILDLLLASGADPNKSEPPLGADVKRRFWLAAP